MNFPVKYDSQPGQKVNDLYSNKSQLSIQGNKKKNENENPYIGNTIKYRIFELEKKIFDQANIMNQHKVIMSSLKDDKENTEETVKKNTKQVTDFLTQEFLKVQNEMNKHFQMQKNENEDLQNEIISLKTEKTKLVSEIISYQRKISELEMIIGIDAKDLFDK